MTKKLNQGVLAIFASFFGVLSAVRTEFLADVVINSIMILVLTFIAYRTGRLDEYE